jgi:hypothetical protein
MARKPKPRVPTAGEVVSFFEDLPVEFAATVLEIVTTRVAIRRAARDAPLLTPKARKPKATVDTAADT